MLALLVVSRREFYAVGDRVGRWYTTRISVQLVLLDIGLGMALVTVNRGRLIGHPSLLTQLDHVVLGLAGVRGPLQFRGERLADIVTATLLALGLLTLFVVAYFVLRPSQPPALLTAEDEQELRDLLA